MRKLMSLVVVLFGALLFVPTVSAQIYDPCTDLSLHPQVRVDCAFAAIATSGYGYPSYGRYGSGYGRYGSGYGRVGERRNDVSPAEVGVGGAIIGGAYGGWKGAAVGGVGGYFGTKIVGAIVNRHQKRDDYREMSRQRSPQYSDQEAAKPGSADSAGSGPYFGQSNGEFELVNNSGAYLDVYDGKEFRMRMQPGEVWQVPPPQNRYRAEALIPNNRGGVSKGDLETQATDSGWIFNRPAAARR